MTWSREELDRYEKALAAVRAKGNATLARSLEEAIRRLKES